jgi:hypothetical protein
MGDIGREIVGDIADDGAEHDDEEVIERVAREVLEDIEHGRVDGDTATLVAARLEQQGIRLRTEAIDSIAEDIEEEASR